MKFVIYATAAIAALIIVRVSVSNAIEFNKPHLTHGPDLFAVWMSVMFAMIAFMGFVGFLVAAFSPA